MIVIGQNGSMEYRPNPLRAAAEPQPGETPLPDDRVDTITVTYSDGTMNKMTLQQYGDMRNAYINWLADDIAARGGYLPCNTQPQPGETPLPARVPAVCEPLPDPEILPLLNRFSHRLVNNVLGALSLVCVVGFIAGIAWLASISPPPPEPGLIYIPGHYIEYHDPY